MSESDNQMDAAKKVMAEDAEALRLLAGHDSAVEIMRNEISLVEQHHVRENERLVLSEEGQHVVHVRAEAVVFSCGEIAVRNCRVTFDLSRSTVLVTKCFSTQFNESLHRLLRELRQGGDR